MVEHKPEELYSWAVEGMTDSICVSSNFTEFLIKRLYKRVYKNRTRTAENILIWQSDTLQKANPYIKY